MLNSCLTKLLIKRVLFRRSLFYTLFISAYRFKMVLFFDLVCPLNKSWTSTHAFKVMWTNYLANSYPPLNKIKRIQYITFSVEQWQNNVKGSNQIWKTAYQLLINFFRKSKIYTEWKYFISQSVALLWDKKRYWFPTNFLHTKK